MKKRALVAVTALVLASLFAGSTPAFADDDYPSWADVQAAKKDEKTKKSEISKIETLVDGLEAKNVELSRHALEVGELYNQAADELDAATTKSNALKKDADAAAATAEKSRAQAGALVAQLARSGGSDITVTLLFNSGDADDFLYALGQLDTLTGQSAEIYAQARSDQNTAKALSAQATVAEKERASIAAKAKAASDTAQAAADAAEISLAEQQKKSDQLYDQLASLKDTTTETEKAYQAGLAWEKAQAAVKNPPLPPVETPSTTGGTATTGDTGAASGTGTPSDTATGTSGTADTSGTSAASGSSGSSSSPSVVSGALAAPNADAVAGAIAYAKAQLGEAYKLGGAGPDVWDCSGLTKMSYASVGVYIGTHSSTNQYSTLAAAGRLLPLASLEAGDLLFYSSGGSTTASKYHTALYIGNGQMIEAPYPGAPVRIKPIRYGDLVPYAARPTP